MPLYEFQCNLCDRAHEGYCSYEESKSALCPDCGTVMQKLISRPGALVTDTSFCMTGKIDSRFGTRPIEGRADWNRRLDEKGYIELSGDDLKKQMD